MRGARTRPPQARFYDAEMARSSEDEEDEVVLPMEEEVGEWEQEQGEEGGEEEGGGSQRAEPSASQRQARADGLRSRFALHPSAQRRARPGPGGRRDRALWLCGRALRLQAAQTAPHASARGGTITPSSTLEGRINAETIQYCCVLLY